MLRNLIVCIVVLFNLTVFSQQERLNKSAVNCEFSESIQGLWILEEIVPDLSQEGLSPEEEKEVREIFEQQFADMKGTITMGIYPDGTFLGTSIEEDIDPIALYGYWNISSDCTQLITVVEGGEDVMKIISLDKTKMVLEMKNEQETLRMIFSKSV